MPTFWPTGRSFNGSSLAVVGPHLTVLAGFSALAAFLLWPVTGGQYPPGVDTPTFLHLSWIAELAVSGELADPLEDPYWYGGFFYLVYPPLSYGLVGLLSAVSSANFVDVYIVLLMLSYGLLGYSAWFLARELNLRWWAALLAGMLAVLAYPSLNAVFLWGWSTSLMSLPFAVLSVSLLERSLRLASWRVAAAAGVLMGVATLAHHMTGAAICMGLLPWFAWRLAFYPAQRKHLTIFCLIAGAVTLVIILPWAIPFLIEASETGFRREMPGNWQASLGAFASNILDPSLVGVFTFPSYLGIVLTALALVGVFLSAVEMRRLAGITLLLLLLLWFSMGTAANPLINHYPLSSLDVGRFHLYMVPFMALLAAAASERMAEWALQRFRLPAVSAVRNWVALAVIVLALVYPGYNAWRARELAEPYVVQPAVRQALDWLAATPLSPEGDPPVVYGVGLWNWHAFLVPTLADRPLIDGWHDEGANEVQKVRRLRQMSWVGGDPVDPVEAHDILNDLAARYVLLHRSYWAGERAAEYWAQFETRPDLYRLRGQWGAVGVFEVLAPVELARVSGTG